MWRWDCFCLPSSSIFKKLWRKDKFHWTMQSTFIKRISIKFQWINGNKDLGYVYVCDWLCISLYNCSQVFVHTCLLLLYVSRELRAHKGKWNWRVVARREFYQVKICTEARAAKAALLRWNWVNVDVELWSKNSGTSLKLALIRRCTELAVLL